MQMNSQIWPQCTCMFDLKTLSVTHSSIADDRSLSFLQFENIAAVGSVGAQEVKFQAFVSVLEQSHIHPLKENGEVAGIWFTWELWCFWSSHTTQMKPACSLTPTANWPMSAPCPRAAAVSSFAILVMKFLALLADWVCMAAQIALATRLVSTVKAADGLLIIPSRTL